MPPLAPQKLRILTFPQRIAGTALDLNVLLLPTQRLLNTQAPFPSAIDPATTVSLPMFIAASLDVKIMAIRGPVGYPFSDPAVLALDGASLDSFPSGMAFPPGLPALYEGLTKQFAIQDSFAFDSTQGALAAGSGPDGIRKYLPRTYRTAFNFTLPRTEYAKTDDSYHCAIRGTAEKDPNFAPPKDNVTWGRVIALCLRQPLLAERIGLLYRVHLTLPSADFWKDGGWLYAELDPAVVADFDIVKPTEVRSYAARIPAISGPRPLFAALQFPVEKGPAQPLGDFDTLKIEAADYDDGFAKVVHATQPVSANLLSEEPDGIHVQKDIGVRLGWDDEQLLIWQNRQVLEDPATPGQRIEAPLGVFFHRVDVRQPGDPQWHSLVRMRSKAALTLAGVAVAPAQIEVETGVQVFPAKINANADTAYWLPSYFTQWYGASLVLPDVRAAELDESGAVANPGTYAGGSVTARPEQKGNLYEALLPDDCELKYGHEYEFRVRFADLTGGGPEEADTALNDAPASSSSLVFRRWVAPKQLTLKPDSPQPNQSSKAEAQAQKFLVGKSFQVARPRLGYPALLFTELDTEAAFAKLLEDRTFLHKGKVGAETIKEQREVAWFDPDVTHFLVTVDVKTLLLDTRDSSTQREAFLPLYSTLRPFAAHLENPFALELEYRDANVIDFTDATTLGDLNLSKAEIDAGPEIVLPSSRDIRITIHPVCADKPALPEYFGFEKRRVGDELLRVGEPVQFFVRQDATDETAFFAQGLETRQLQGLYLQPDPPQVNNASTIVADVVAGSELGQTTLMQRLAAQLHVDFKGLSLIGKPGERVQFGCSNHIRHTLAPDGSSLTFATTGDLVGHWLCVLSFEVHRDWTWDGLSDSGIEVSRTKQFTDEAATTETEIVGYVQLHRAASRVATTSPDRSFTRVVFVDAVEPKKDQTKPESQAQPFPNTIDVAYALTPAFIPSVGAGAAPRERVIRDLRLPVTTIPKQVPEIVAAGYALSPYVRDTEYSETAVRRRCLWLEFREPIEDPNDAYFARVLAYAPDPLLSFPNPDQFLARQDDPPLAIDPELIRVISKGSDDDHAGLDAMQPMTPETGDPSTPLIKVTPVHYLLPLPPGLHDESPELFGFFTYELRVGHTSRIWSTARGRFGQPTRLNGVQHPAPPLPCLVDRTPTGIKVSVPHAVAVFNGRNVTSRPPKTEIWCLLYAQALQADGRRHRNILLAEGKLQQVEQETVDVGTFLAQRAAMTIEQFNSLPVNLDAPAVGAFNWSENEIRDLLEYFHLALDTPVSVLAVEMMPRYDRFVLFGTPPDESIRPLSRELGQYRILRTSRLVPAPDICCEACD